MRSSQSVLIFSLTVLVLFSAVGVVYAKYESRRLFVDLQQIRQQHDNEEMDWGRLQLELATVGALGRVQRLAEKKLHMAAPMPEQIVVVE